MPEKKHRRRVEEVLDLREIVRDSLDALLVEGGYDPSVRLVDFKRQHVPELSIEDRLTLVEQALVLMRDFYVNLPLKEALQAALPVRRLELLQLDLEARRRQRRRDVLPSTLEFHREMNEIFTSVHDRHVRYMLPEPFAGRWAFLGFDVEEFYGPLSEEAAASTTSPGEVRRMAQEKLVPEPLRFEVVDEIQMDAEGRAVPGRVIESLSLDGAAGPVARRRRYMVVRPVAGLEKAARAAATDCHYLHGAEIVSWNGIAIERAVELNGDRHAGANRAARLARGLSRLTVRPLRLSPLPEEDWVVIGYRDPCQPEKTRHILLEWRVVSLEREEDERPAALPVRVVSEIRLDSEAPFEVGPVEEIRLDDGEIRLGLEESRDEEAFAVGQLRKGLKDCSDDSSGGEVGRPARLADSLSDRSDERRAVSRLGRDRSELQEVLQAVPVRSRLDGTQSTFAYFRIYTFDIDPWKLVDEFVRLLTLFQEEHRARGLIIDARDNGGGQIPAGELILQTLTGRTIEPARFEFLSNPVTLAYCRRNAFLRRWAEALELGARIGAKYSRGFPITRGIDRVPRVFDGPVVLIVNALSYSTTDILAAGFQDHEIGPIISTDDNVGAGGANTVSHDDLLVRWRERSPLVPLPGGVGMKVAIRRSLRVGERAGTPLEELGIEIEPENRHYMTADDLLFGNRDLIRKAIEVLQREAERRASPAVLA